MSFERIENKKRKKRLAECLHKQIHEAAIQQILNRSVPQGAITSVSYSPIAPALMPIIPIYPLS
jgi:ribosome-binding factor A